MSILARAAQPVVQPGAGVGPGPAGRGPRDAQALRRLLQRQAGEVTQPDQSRLLRVLLGEQPQRLVQRDQVERWFVEGRLDLVEVNALAPTAPFQAMPLARSFDEDAPDERQL